MRAKLVGPSSACPFGRLPVPAVLIPGCPALPCKVSSLVAVETLHLGLVRNLLALIVSIAMFHLKSISSRSSG
ncbi:hypothetical protein Tco_0219234 [Tanacetum coccineum]